MDTSIYRNLSKNLKSVQVINGYYFLHELFYLAFFSLQLADIFKVTAREKETQEQVSEMFFKCYLFQTFRNSTF